MTAITLSISKELKSEMEEFPEINWSEVARAAFRQKIADLKFLREFKAQSDITPEDAERLGREISANLAKRYQRSK
ncbi:MAG TPA: hypothetical protein VKK79_15650 [Candidatus Lokiarchaeia archaeon]|nr:hypothetical protein [Candidatus Lokiarchaeia archaeon]